jgi:hypothetical protein
VSHHVEEKPAAQGDSALGQLNAQSKIDKTSPEKTPQQRETANHPFGRIKVAQENQKFRLESEKTKLIETQVGKETTAALSEELPIQENSTVLPEAEKNLVERMCPEGYVRHITKEEKHGYKNKICVKLSTLIKGLTENECVEDFKGVVNKSNREYCTLNGLNHFLDICSGFINDKEKYIFYNVLANDKFFKFQLENGKKFSCQTKNWKAITDSRQDGLYHFAEPSKEGLSRMKYINYKLLGTKIDSQFEYLLYKKVKNAGYKDCRDFYDHVQGVCYISRISIRIKPVLRLKHVLSDEDLNKICSSYGEYLREGELCLMKTITSRPLTDHIMTVENPLDGEWNVVVMNKAGGGFKIGKVSFGKPAL